MRVLITHALLLQFAVSCIQAGRIAGAYERLFVYFVYRIDLQLPIDQRTFLPCAGHDVGGFCTFSELMTQMEGRPGVQWLPDGMTSIIKDDKTPTIDQAQIDEAVQHMTDNRLTDARFQLSQLLVSGQDSFTGGIWELSKTVQLATDSLRPWLYQPWSLASKSCLRAAFEQRTYEYHDYMFRHGLDDRFHYAGLTVGTTENDKGQTIYDVKGSAGYAQNSHLGDPAEVRRLIYGVMDDFNHGDLTARDHNRVIKTESTALSKTDWRCKCCFTEHKSS